MVRYTSVRLSTDIGGRDGVGPPSIALRGGAREIDLSAQKAALPELVVGPHLSAGPKVERGRMSVDVQAAG